MSELPPNLPGGPEKYDSSNQAEKETDSSSAGLDPEKVEDDSQDIVP